MIDNNLIILIDGFGFAFFCAALFFGMHNYKRYSQSRVLWAIFNISMFIGALMALYNALEWMSFYPILMDEISDSLNLVLVALLFTFTIVEKEESSISGI